MITVASVDYCERCKCRTVHVPLPSGERACEHHPPGTELAPSSPPAPRCPLCGMASPGGTLHHVGCGVGAPPATERERAQR